MAPHPVPVQSLVQWTSSHSEWLSADIPERLSKEYATQFSPRTDSRNQSDQIETRLLYVAHGIESPRSQTVTWPKACSVGPILLGTAGQALWIGPDGGAQRSALAAENCAAAHPKPYQNGTLQKLLASPRKVHHPRELWLEPSLSTIWLEPGLGGSGSGVGAPPRKKCRHAVICSYRQLQYVRSCTIFAISVYNRS